MVPNPLGKHQARTLRFVRLETGCYVCLSHKLNHDGYFRKRWGNTRSNDLHFEFFHRYIWRAHKGPIPPGMEVDHMCKVRACCNVEHLRLLTRPEHAAETNRTRTLRRNLR